MNDIIHQYTRGEAIADGVLIDVSTTAQEAGIRFPTAVTAAVWAECIAVPSSVPWQDEQGRLWDVLTMLRYAIKQSDGGSRIDFSVLVQNQPERDETMQLYALCHGGDNAEPVITIMLPHED